MKLITQKLTPQAYYNNTIGFACYKVSRGEKNIMLKQR